MVKYLIYSIPSGIALLNVDVNIVEAYDVSDLMCQTRVKSKKELFEWEDNFFSFYFISTGWSKSLGTFSNNDYSIMLKTFRQYF